MLRQLQLPLAAVKELLACDPADAATRIAEHWRDAEAAHDARRELADYLVSRLSGKRPVMYEVATREMPERSLLCLKRNVDEQGQWAFGKEFIAILRERPLPKIEGREGAAFCIQWGWVSADSDGPVEWCKPVPQAEAHALAEHYPELTLRTEPAHREAFVALPAGPGGNQRCTGSSLSSHCRPGCRSRSRSTRVSVLPSRPKTSACASPISRPDPSPSECPRLRRRPPVRRRAMIEAHGLVKRYGSTMAVNDLSFSIRPGMVTGFLGPNGAGKTTTMRMILGLDAPTQGSVTVGGRSYRDLPAPMREVGALLDAKALHGGRRARDHLLCLAQSNGIPRSRVDEVLRIVGLEGVARRRAKGFSLGMGQRLGIASALLGDPAVLIFDEPVNGLDPDGIHWVRTLLRALAAEGRTVLVSSHLMSEMALTADHLLVIGKGRLIADTSVDEFVRSSSQQSVHVRSPQAAELAARCREAGATVRAGSTSRAAAAPVAGPDAGTDPDVIEITGMDSAEVGRLAAAHGIALSELIPVRASLEEAFMELTRDSVEYQAAGATR